MDKLITVYTPVYNRSYIISRLYNSLVNQTSSNFVWLIIDDGSTDDLASLVEEWIAEEKVPITYYFQQNKGKQEAVNFAHQHIDTELNVCVDSDDYLLPDAIAIIEYEWNEIKNDS